ncbi:MAG: type II toxin-antitoxin system PemK/MazF family toxin [Patescibacteria group bacterium]|nr:type II toxin-antitoxin system PemK/MazF family toxin [Patescibacteria group bacterium]
MDIAESLNKFIAWTKIKIRLHIKEPPTKLYFYEREIWWASLGANIGYEQDGKNEVFERPVLVIKKFNKDLFWMVPLTRQGKENRYYFKLRQDNENSFIILSQIRTISSKRLIRKIRMVDEKEYLDIKKRIAEFLI